MLKFNVALLFVIVLLISNCGTDSKPVAVSNQTYQNPLKNVSVRDLNSDEEISQFLVDLMEQDQFIRKLEPKTTDDKNKNRQERFKHSQQLITSDKINLQKAKEFLDFHGFPDPTKHGEDGYRGILFVLHHSPRNNIDRHKYLPVFYDAFKEGKIAEELFDFYLGRMYDFEFGKRIKMDSPFKPAERIEKYLEAFNFKPN